MTKKAHSNIMESWHCITARYMATRLSKNPVYVFANIIALPFNLQELSIALWASIPPFWIVHICLSKPFELEKNPENMIQSGENNCDSFFYRVWYKISMYCDGQGDLHNAEKTSDKHSKTDWLENCRYHTSIPNIRTRLFPNLHDWEACALSMLARLGRYSPKWDYQWRRTYQ